jgi:hypothetical protein
VGMSSLLVQVVKLPTGWAVRLLAGGAVVVALGIGVTGSAPTPPNGSPTTPASPITIDAPNKVDHIARQDIPVSPNLVRETNRPSPPAIQYDRIEYGGLPVKVSVFI